jgi:hypothetical protein
MPIKQDEANNMVDPLPRRITDPFWAVNGLDNQILPSWHPCTLLDIFIVVLEIHFKTPKVII